MIDCERLITLSMISHFVRQDIRNPSHSEVTSEGSDMR